MATKKDAAKPVKPKKAAKKPSKAKKKLLNSIYYLNSRKKKIENDLKKYAHYKETTKIEWGKNPDGTPKKRMIKTIRNLLVNKQIAYNTKYQKQIKLLDKRYKYGYQKTDLKAKNKIGLINSPLFLAFEGVDAKKFSSAIIDKSMLFHTFNEIDKAVKTMTSKDMFQIVYNRALLEDLKESETNFFEFVNEIVSVNVVIG